MLTRFEIPLRAEKGIDFSKYDVISFDVFDTLILRTVANPCDVFSLVKLRMMGSHEALVYPEVIDAFPTLRVEAEQRARLLQQQRLGTTETTLGEIYRALAEMAAIPHPVAEVLRQGELDVERRVVYANPEVLPYWNSAIAQGKKVILCSDMYLTGSSISQLLVICGYEGWDQLYVSCEHGCSKNEGTLFDHISGALRIRKDRILHIGDNYDSDFVKARRAGWNALFLERPSSEPLRIVEAGQSRADTKEIVASSCRGIQQKLSTGGNLDPWEKLGYRIFGPLFTGFLIWLLRSIQMSNPEAILLFARDAHFFYEHLPRLMPPSMADLPLRYVYASRGSLLFPGLTDFSLPRLWHLFSGKKTLPISAHLRRFGLTPELAAGAVRSAGFSSIHEAADHRDPRMHALFSCLFEHLLSESKRQRPLAQQYLRQCIGEAKRLMLVDVGWAGNMQASVARLLEPEAGAYKIQGHYFGTYGMAWDNRYQGHTMSGWLTNFGQSNGVEEGVWWSGGAELLEFALCAPHGSTLRYALSESGQATPILETSSDDEQSRSKARKIQNGSVRFLEEYLGICECVIDPGVALSSPQWAADFLRLVTNPTVEEAELLGDITHSDAAGTSERRLALAPILNSRNPTEIDKAWESCFWKAGFLARNGLRRKDVGVH